MTDWGIPDWRDSSAYPNAEDLSIDEWRWEFLHRRDDYRKDYIRPESDFVDESRARYFEQKYSLVNVANPSRSVCDMKSPSQDDDEIFLPMFDVQFWDTRKGIRYSFPWPEEKLPGKDPQPQDMDFRIDLLQPLSPQFDRAKKIAVYCQQKQRGLSRDQIKKRPKDQIIKRPNINNWPRYLRALDAREQGATYREIGELLLGHKDYDVAAKRAKEIHKAAKALQKQFPIYPSA